MLNVDDNIITLSVQNTIFPNINIRPLTCQRFSYDNAIQTYLMNREEKYRSMRFFHCGLPLHLCNDANYAYIQPKLCYAL